MKDYYVPAGRGEGELEAKGSRFYAVTVPAQSEEDVQALLDQARARHPEANHHAYAYRLGLDGEIARFSDDGEPGGTAGRPIMEILLREDLVNVAAVVSRHFGGTLLGAGGLVHAYGGAAAEAIRAAGRRVLRPHERLRVSVDYAAFGVLERGMSRFGVRQIDAAYGAHVTLTLLVPVDQSEQFRRRVQDITAGQAVVVPLGMTLAE